MDIADIVGFYFIILYERQNEKKKKEKKINKVNTWYYIKMHQYEKQVKTEKIKVDKGIKLLSGSQYKDDNIYIIYYII